MREHSAQSASYPPAPLLVLQPGIGAARPVRGLQQQRRRRKYLAAAAASRLLLAPRRGLRCFGGPCTSSLLGVASDCCCCSCCSWKLFRQLSSFRTYSALPHLISLLTAVADVPGVLVTCVHVSGAARALQGVLRRTTSQMALGRLWAAATTTCRRAYTMQFSITHDYQF